MMGHTISTYHDIEMKGIDFLRSIYQASGLSIRPKTTAGKIETLKEILRAWGLNPEEILSRQALTTPYQTPHTQVETLSKELRDTLRRDILQDNQTTDQYKSAPRSLNQS